MFVILPADKPAEGDVSVLELRCVVVVFVLRMANLSYIRNFCFSHSSKDELSYCLSTFEAAVEYINLGKLHDSHAVGYTHFITHTRSPSCFSAAFLTVPSCPPPPHCQGSGELNDKALFKERMSLLCQSATTPIHCLFEVRTSKVKPGK